jgi:LacI family transcriptional regulator
MKRSRDHATLADVALRAGVGKTTVSRVINGAHKVSAQTLERINKVILELGYHPSQAARSLKGERSRTLGLILPRIADPFFACCAEVVHSLARAHGYLLMVAATDYDPQLEIKEIYTLLRHRVDGILISPADSASRKLSDIVAEINIPVVTFNHPLMRARVRSVLADNYQGARLATEHLIGHGCQRVLCLGGDATLYSVKERQRGYRDAMRAAELDVHMEESANDSAEVARVIRAEWKKQKPIDGIFAVRNLITIYAFQTLQAMRIKIGEQVALIGFDDFDLASTLRPAVSVVKQPVEQMASRAANVLFDEIENTTHSRRASIKLQTSLILRNSCGCRAVTR